MSEIEFYCDPQAPVQPDQFAGEFGELLSLFVDLKPLKILEVGVRQGGTLYQWIKHAPPGAQVVALDLPGADWGSKEPPALSDWQAWADRHQAELTPIIGDSHSLSVVEQARAYMPYDFVFLDGDHSYSGIMCDLLNYLPMTRPGGVLACHDVIPDESDSRIQTWRVWLELIMGRYKTATLISDPSQKSRGIGVIYV